MKELNLNDLNLISGGMNHPTIANDKFPGTKHFKCLKCQNLFTDIGTLLNVQCPNCSSREIKFLR